MNGNFGHRPVRRQRLLVFQALATWRYRLVVFTAIAAGQTARFYFEANTHPPLDGLLASIDPAAVLTLPDSYLASIYGGDLPVHATDRGFKPHESVFGVSLTLTAANRLPLRVLRGKARILGRPRSPVGRLLRAARAVIIRESGF